MIMTNSLVQRNLVIQIEGDIDHHSAALIKQKIDKEFSRAQAKNIIFDFSKVTFMDSSGIGMIIGRYKLLEASGGTLLIASINPEVSKIFELSGLKKIIKTCESVEQAINEL